MKRFLARVFGLALVTAAIRVVWVELPAAYPWAFKVTGLGIVTRADINKVALAYGITGVVGGLGLALVLGFGKRGKR